MRRELTDRDFDELSWHDCEIRGVELRVGDPERGDWTSDLALDIDYIAEWVSRDDRVLFRMAPATLVFHGVTELRVELDGARAGPQVSLTLPSIAAIERERVAEQRIFLDRPYYRWRIRLNGIPDGEIAFGAVGFTQTLRARPVLCDQPHLARALRDAG